MIYQLKNGSTIEMSVEQYLSMSDAELDYLNSTTAGDSIDNPWFGSILSKVNAHEDMEEYIEDSILSEDDVYDAELDIEDDLDLTDL